jgi:hypothetical protein
MSGLLALASMGRTAEMLIECTAYNGSALLQAAPWSRFALEGKRGRV